MSWFGRKVARRAGQREMAKAGWGVKHEWRAPRTTGGAPLYFSVRVPNGFRFLDVGELAAQAGERLPSGARAGVAALDQVDGQPGTICTAALIDDDHPENVLVVLTAGLAEGLSGRPDVDRLGLQTPGEEVQRFVTELSEKAVLLDRVTMLQLEPGAEPAPMMLHQYLMQTRYGALSMAFTSTQREMFSEQGRKLMADISETGWLGETENLV
jgi:hypothetical protein